MVLEDVVKKGKVKKSVPRNTHVGLSFVALICIQNLEVSHNYAHIVQFPTTQ